MAVYKIEDYGSHVADNPASSLKEIRQGLHSVFSEIPCVKKVGIYGKWATGKAEEGDPIEIVLFPDWEYGISVRGVMEYADHLLFFLGRDVDVVTDREWRREAHPEMRVLYGRPDWAVEDIEWDVAAAERAARHATLGLTMDGLKADAAEIASDAARAARCGLTAALKAMGGWVGEESTIPAIYERARDKGGIEDNHHIAHCCRDLGYLEECADFGMELRVADALLAVCSANRVAGELHAAGRPAAWVSVRDREVLGLMRTLEFAEPEPELEVLDDVEFLRRPGGELYTTWGPGKVQDVVDRAGDLDESGGRWWTVDVRDEKGKLWTDVSPWHVRKAE